MNCGLDMNLIPVLGTSLILLHGRANGVVKSTFSQHLFVGLGLVSYSAYLWHHPLMAAARSLSDGRSPNSLLMLALVVLTFLLAFLTWKFVEQPWRKPKDSKFMFGRRALVAAGVSTFLLISVDLQGTLQMAGQTDFPELQDITHRLRHNRGLNERCSEGFVAGDECRSGPSPKMMVWGDSIAMHLMDGLTVGAGDQNLVQSTMSACAPVLGIASYSAGLGANWSDACIRHNDQTFAYLQAKNEIEIVVLCSAFTGFFDNKRNPLRAANGRQLEAVYSTEQALRKTLDAVSRTGRKVVVVAPAPAAKISM